MKTRKQKAADYIISNSSSEFSPTNQCKLAKIQLLTPLPLWATSHPKSAWIIRKELWKEEEFQRKVK